MKCPHCVQSIHRGAELCPHCGWSIADIDDEYAEVERRIRRINDGAGLLRREERERVEAAMKAFERRFPQLFFAVRTGVPGQPGNVREFGFWLLNRARFLDLPEGRTNAGALLLTIDPTEKSAGLSWGYLLDAHLSENDSFVFLSRAHAHWVEGRYSEGIVKGLGELVQMLERRSRRARRRFGRSREVER